MDQVQLQECTIKLLQIAIVDGGLQKGLGPDNEVNQAALVQACEALCCATIAALMLAFAEKPEDLFAVAVKVMQLTRDQAVDLISLGIMNITEVSSS